MRPFRARAASSNVKATLASPASLACRTSIVAGLPPILPSPLMAWPGPTLRAITVPSIGALMAISGLISRSLSRRATSRSLRPSTRRRLRAALRRPLRS